MDHISNINSQKKAFEFLNGIDVNYDFNHTDSNQYSNLNNILFHLFDYNILGNSEENIKKGLKNIDLKLITQHIIDTDSNANILIRIISKRTSSKLISYILDNVNLLDSNFVDSKGFQFVLNNHNWSYKENVYCADFIMDFHKRLYPHKKLEKQVDNIVFNYFITNIYTNNDENSMAQVRDTVFNLLKAGRFNFSDINESNIDLIKNKTPAKEDSFVIFYNYLAPFLGDSEKEIFNHIYSNIENKHKFLELKKIKDDILHSSSTGSKDLKDVIVNYYSTINNFINEQNISITKEQLDSLKISKKIIADIEHNKERYNHFKSPHKFFRQYEDLIPKNNRSRESLTLTEVSAIFTTITGIDLTEQLKSHYNISKYSSIEESLKIVEEEHSKLENSVQTKKSLRP